MEPRIAGRRQARGRDRLPWRYDAAFQAQHRALLERRMRLLPLLYSLANSSTRNGVMMQPLAYRYLGNGHNFQRRDDLRIYLPGNGALLVAVAMMAAGRIGARLSGGRRLGGPGRRIQAVAVSAAGSLWLRPVPIHPPSPNR